MALYNGQALFGNSVVVKVIDHPLASQKSSFFGVNGVAALFGGARAPQIEVRGILIADDVSDLASLISTIKSFRDGVGRPFIDNYGNTFNNTLMGEYRPAADRVYQVPGGGIAEVYTVSLEYLGG